MLSASAFTTDLGALTFSARVCVREERGIHKIRILDREGFEISAIVIEECPTEHCVNIENEPRSRLPLRAEVSNCTDGDSPTSDPLLIELIVVNPESGELDCRRSVLEDLRPPNPACDNARSELRAERAAIRRACNQVDYYKRRRDEFFTLAAFFAGAAAAAFIGAASVAGIPIVGQILMAVLIGIAVFSLYFAALYGLKAFQENQRLEKAEAELRDRRNAFDDAAERVSQNCCPGTFDESLDPPEC